MTSDEIRKIVRRHYPAKSTAEIAAMLGVGHRRVQRAAISIFKRTKSGNNKLWTKDEDAYLLDNYGAVPNAHIAAALGRTLAAVQCRLKWVGLVDDTYDWDDPTEAEIRERAAAVRAEALAAMIEPKVEKVEFEDDDTYWLY